VVKKYKGIIKDKQTLLKFLPKAEDIQSYPMKDGRSEIIFSFLEKVILSNKGATEKAAYILTNGVLILTTEEKEEIIDIVFVEGKQALRIIFSK